MDRKKKYMRKHSFLYTIGIMLVGALLVVGSVSLTMTFLSDKIEEQNAPTLVENALDYDSSSVIQILGTGMVDYNAEEEVIIATTLDETISNYNTSVYHQITPTNTAKGQSLAGTFIQAGFTTVGLANSQSLAVGKEGIDASVAYWETQDILSAGINISTDSQNINRPFEVNGISIVYLSFTVNLNDELPEHEQYLVNLYNDENSPAIVEEARSVADVVIVSLYWDNEGFITPTDRQKEIATKLADSGASIIFANAKDAIQPIEWIDDTLVFYSMGNMLSDSEEETDHLGLLGAVTITKHTVYDKKRIELTNPKVDFVTSRTEDGITTVEEYDATNASDTIQELVESTKPILHQLDDSIRIGGIQ